MDKEVTLATGIKAAMPLKLYMELTMPAVDGFSSVILENKFVVGLSSWALPVYDMIYHYF